MAVIELGSWPVFDDNLFDILEDERWVLLKCQRNHEMLANFWRTCMSADGFESVHVVFG